MTTLIQLQDELNALEQKRTNNTNAIKAAREKSERQRDFAIEAETEEASAGFRAVLLEVESLELMRDELTRRNERITAQIEVARREEDEKNARETLSARAADYSARKARAFELRAQIAVAVALVPGLFDELVSLRCEADELADAARILGDERAREFGGDANVLLWHSRDAIAGGFPGFAEPVQSLFDAVAFDRSQDNRDQILEMQRQANLPRVGDQQTDEQRTAEAAALQRYQRGDRGRDETFAFNNWKREQKGIEIEAENVRRALEPTR